MRSRSAAAVLGVGWAVFANGLLCCLGIGLAYAYLLRHRGNGMNFEYVMPVEDDIPAGPGSEEAKEIDAGDTGVR